MKKILLVIAFQLMVALIGYSQEKFGFEKGDYLITGIIGYNNTSFQETNSNKLNLSTKLSTFFSSNWNAGINIGFGQKKEDADVVTLNKSTVELGAYASYYFTPKDPFTISTSLGFNYNKEKDVLTKMKNEKIEIAIYPGFHYFLSHHFILEASLGRVSLERSKLNESNITQFNLNAQIKSITFGLTYKW